ncbi:MAG: DUF4279 domain-containing protein [Microvirga sp.]
MSVVHETAVGLRFQGEDLDPRTVSALPGAKPTLAAARNETWHTPNGTAVVARLGFWHFGTERSRPGDLDLQIARILSKLTDDLDIWQQLTSRYESDLFCGVFLSEDNQGISVKPETLVMAGQRGLLLDLDIYRQE